MSYERNSDSALGKNLSVYENSKSVQERLVMCPKCEREWNGASEQAVSVDWHGECVVCKFTPQGNGSNDGTEAELLLIADESLKRRSE